MASGWVVAETQGGLGNRLRVLLGCLAYADHVGARFAYVWPRKDFGARMGDLWAFAHPCLPTGLGRVARHLLTTSDEHLADGAEGKRFRYVVTDQRIELPAGAGAWASYLCALEPRAEIADAVRETWARHLGGAPYVGVMVRAHPSAHPTTTTTSPVDWFLHRMHEVRRALGDVSFFLSCDDPGAQQAIVDGVPGVLALQKHGRFNSRQGLEEAVVDLYLLASSGYLIGPFWSSFVELAHELGGRTATLETPLEDGSGLPRLCPPAVDPLRPATRRG